MKNLNLFRNCLILFLFVQLGQFLTVDGKPGKRPTSEEKEKMLMSKIKSASSQQLRKGQRQAAIKLQSNFGKVLTAMDSKKSSMQLTIPMDVKEDIKTLLNAIKGGQFNDSIYQSVPSVMMNATGSPSEQIQVIIGDILPRGPPNLKQPLQGVFDFVKENQAGVNRYLSKVINGSPNLLNGVVQSLASTVGATNSAVGGTGDSLNQMVGGLLSGLPVNGLLPA